MDQDNFSNRLDTFMWFTKSEPCIFLQNVPGTHRANADLRLRSNSMKCVS